MTYSRDADRSNPAMGRTMSTPMQPEQRDVNTEIIERLERIEAGVKATNGRVTTLEGWRTQHQSWSEDGRLLIENQRQSIDTIQERMTEIMLACQTTPGNLEHAVARVMDKRQTTEDAARYRALTKRFGAEPEEDLARWGGLQAGVRAIGWRVATTIVTILVTAMLAAAMSIWAVSL